MFSWRRAHPVPEDGCLSPVVRTYRLHDLRSFDWSLPLLVFQLHCVVAIRLGIASDPAIKPTFFNLTFFRDVYTGPESTSEATVLRNYRTSYEYTVDYFSWCS